MQFIYVAFAFFAALGACAKVSTAGACCSHLTMLSKNTTCTDNIEPLQCTASAFSGVFAGAGSSCASRPCDRLTGACCKKGGTSCLMTSDFLNTCSNGVFAGFGRGCSACIRSTHVTEVDDTVLIVFGHVLAPHGAPRSVRGRVALMSKDRVRVAESTVSSHDASFMLRYEHGPVVHAAPFTVVLSSDSSAIVNNVRNICQQHDQPVIDVAAGKFLRNVHVTCDGNKDALQRSEHALRRRRSTSDDDDDDGDGAAFKTSRYLNLALLCLMIAVCFIPCVWFAVTNADATTSAPAKETPPPPPATPSDSAIMAHVFVRKLE